MPQKIGRKIAGGAIWMIVMRFSIKGISIISTIILARLLTPDDFGVIAMAMSVYAIIELLRAFGFETVLIQNQEAGKDHYDTAWSMQVIFSFIAAIVLLALALPTSNFYVDERLFPVLCLMAPLFIINGFNNIGTVEFRKNFEFSREFNYKVAVKICGFLTTIPMAFWLRSYWALFAGMYSMRIISLILSYVMHPFRPNFKFTKWREMIRFSSWLLLNNFLSYLNRYSQNFILGKMVGGNALGLLSLSNRIATITSEEIIAPINRAAYPGYAKIADDRKELKDTYLKVLSHIILIAAPCSLGLMAIAPLFVPILLGEKWTDAIPVIQYISLAGLFLSINTNSGYIYIVLEKQKFTTILMIIRLIILIPLIIVLAQQEYALGVAKATLIVSVIIFPINQSMMKYILNIRFYELGRILIRPVLASIIMAYCIFQYTTFIGAQLLDLSGVISLLIGVLMGVAVFVFLLLVFWLIAGKPKGAEKWIINQAHERIKW